MEIYYHPQFEKAYRRLPPEVKSKAERKELIFRVDPFDARLDIHKLHGKLKSKWSFSIDYRNRVLFEFDSAKNVTFLDIGDHEIYR